MIRDTGSAGASSAASECVLGREIQVTVASPGSMHDAGCLGLVHWDDPEGWYGEGRGRWGSGLGTRVHPWWIHVDVWQNQYNIVK